MQQRVADYVNVMREVPGWCHPVDVVMFDLIDRVQGDRSATGDLLEIGVYRGKSACFLGYAPRAGEKLVVCDLFEDEAGADDNQRENAVHYPELAQHEFEKHFLRFHAALPEIHRCLSTDLADRLTADSYRFIHVDGSHLYDVVRDDVELALRLATADAVVVFDDFREAHTPGVAAAAWSAVASGRLVPLAMTPSKLYTAVSAASAASILDAIGREPGLIRTAHHVCGHNCFGLELDPSEIPARPRHRRVGRHLRQAASELFH